MKLKRAHPKAEVAKLTWNLLADYLAAQNVVECKWYRIKGTTRQVLVAGYGSLGCGS